MHYGILLWSQHWPYLSLREEVSKSSLYQSTVQGPVADGAVSQSVSNLTSSTPAKMTNIGLKCGTSLAPERTKNIGFGKWRQKPNSEEQASEEAMLGGEDAFAMPKLERTSFSTGQHCCPMPLGAHTVTQIKRMAKQQYNSLKILDNFQVNWIPTFGTFVDFVLKLPHFGACVVFILWGGGSSIV